jgi:chromosome segregation ATPase
MNHQPRINTAINHQVSRQQSMHAPEVVTPQMSRSPGMQLSPQLLELQQEHDQVQYNLAAELDEAELKLDACTRELSLTHNENQAWQDHAYNITQSLEKYKTGVLAQPRITYGAAERAQMQADILQLLEALRMTQDQVDITEREGKAINETLRTQAAQVQTLQMELAAAQTNLVSQQQQRALADQTGELKKRCDFFKRNSEKLSEQVRDLSGAHDGMKDALKAKEAEIRELKSLLSAHGH